MRCPHCNEEFPLTWGRYWRSPAGGHICPHCQKPSRFRISAYSLLLRVPVFCLGAIPVGLICHIWLSITWSLVGFMAGGILVALPIDKFIDGRYRRLEKVDANDAA